VASQLEQRPNVLLDLRHVRLARSAQQDRHCSLIICLLPFLSVSLEIYAAGRVIVVALK
jgi:hypothetical protein